MSEVRKILVTGIGSSGLSRAIASRLQDLLVADGSLSTRVEIINEAPTQTLTIHAFDRPNERSVLCGSLIEQKTYGPAIRGCGGKIRRW